ncbi:uncharacterized protein [Clytia hemisphaerica]|uniref:uncharacterized protein isoform X2 n=1 Tax=Clytia hemisphaerica TaxID=252671 RepID=UPI0034D7023C
MKDMEVEETVNEEELNNETSWSEKMLKLTKSIHSFNSQANYDDESKDYVPFLLNDAQIGLVSPEVIKEMSKQKAIFIIAKDLLTGKTKFTTMALSLKDREERSTKLACFLRDLKDRDVFPTLRGWRNETYEVKESFNSEVLLDVERSACCLFGFHTYGVHVNGYVKNDQGDVYMWVSRRAKTKPTYPGKLDNTVAGGIASGESVKQTLERECLEEAGITGKFSSQARPAGTISYFLSNELGLHPETEFVYDLELPRSFEPKCNDDEVSDFYLLPIKEVKELISTKEFKPNSALVILDFLIRHGSIKPDEEPHYVEFVKGCHRTLAY